MTQPSHKACSKCGVIKSLEDFHRDKRTGDGRRADCKTCVAERKARYFAAHPEKRQERLEYYTQWRADNREQHLSQRRSFHAANRGRLLEANHAYREANREALTEKERQRRESMRAAVFAHYGTACACCGGTDDLNIDHIHGGGSQHRFEVLGRAKVAGWVFYRWLIENDFPHGFQALCAPCNRSKHTGERCRLDHGKVA